MPLNANLSGGVDVAVVAGGVAVHQDAIANHEVAVAHDVVEGVELGKGLLQESADLVVRARGSKLGKDDRLATADLVGLLKLGEESVNSRGRGVPVDVAEVESTAAVLSAAGIDEALEPRKTLAISTRVGDRGSTDKSLARVLVQELGVSSSGSSRRQVRLRRNIGLVEGEDGLGAGGKSGLSLSIEASGVFRLRSPESGNIAVLAGVDARGPEAPVVGPVALVTALTEGVGQGAVVVSQTTLAGETTNGSRRGAGGLAGGSRGGGRRRSRLRRRGRRGRSGSGSGSLRAGRGSRSAGRCLLRGGLRSRRGGLGNRCAAGHDGSGRRRTDSGDQGGGVLGGSGSRWGRSSRSGRGNDDGSGRSDSWDSSSVVSGRGTSRVDILNTESGAGGGSGSRGSGSRRRRVNGDIDGLPNGAPVGLEDSLVHLVLVAVGVESHGLTREGSDGGEGNGLVHFV